MDLKTCSDDQYLRSVSGTQIILILDIKIEDTSARSRDDRTVIDRYSGSCREVERIACEGFDISVVKSPVYRLRISQDKELTPVVFRSAVGDLTVRECYLGVHDKF